MYIIFVGFKILFFVDLLNLRTQVNRLQFSRTVINNNKMQFESIKQKGHVVFCHAISW